MCFAHEGFYIMQQKQRVCTCGAVDVVQNQDANLFSLLVNSFELIKTLKLIKTQSNEDFDKLLLTHENFFWALRHRMSEKQSKCVDPDQQDKGHTSTWSNKILNAPQVFVLNLQWVDPTPMDIFKVLLALPGTF